VRPVGVLRLNQKARDTGIIVGFLLRLEFARASHCGERKLPAAGDEAEAGAQVGRKGFLVDGGTGAQGIAVEKYVAPRGARPSAAVKAKRLKF
jgi:hypothetical protein